MNFEGGDHYKINRSIGVPLGLWPYRCTILGKVTGAIALTIIVLYMVAQLAVFVTHEFSVDLFLKCGTGMAPPTFYVLKYFYFMWHMDQVKYTFEWIQSDYDSLTNERELRSTEKYIDCGRSVNNFIFYSFLLAIIPIGLPFLPGILNIEIPLNQTRMVLLPINVEYFVDQDRYFNWIALHFDAATLLGVFIVFVTETTTIHFVTHAGGLLEISGDRVERLLDSSVPTALCDKTYLSMKSQLADTIKMHQHVLEFIENMNTFLIPQYCLIAAIGVVSLSMNLYIHWFLEKLNHFVMFAMENSYSNQLAREILLMKVTSEMLVALVLIILHFIYMSFTNYVGQLLLDKGDELFTKTYYGRWYESPLPVQKMMVYIRLRSMQPTGLVIGGLYTVSLVFLSKLVNTSMSYFMMIYSSA